MSVSTTEKPAQSCAGGSPRTPKQRVEIVILAGTVGREGGWTGGLPRPLLPLVDRPLVGALIARLQAGLSGPVTVCANGNTELVASRLAQCGLATRLKFHRDHMPRGSAGCLKDALNGMADGTVLVAGGAVWLEDDPRWMLEQHRASGNALSLFCVRDAAAAEGDQASLRPVSIYCCEPVVLHHIRSLGFQDLKEQVVPALQKAGLRVGVITLREQTHEVCDWSGYTHALGRSIATQSFNTGAYRQIAPDIWCGGDVSIAGHARVVGPVVLGPGCAVEEGAVIVGPSVIGSRTKVATDARLIRAVVPSGTELLPGAAVADRLLFHSSSDGSADSALETDEAVGDAVGREAPAASGTFGPLPGPQALLACGVVAAMFGWAFRATIANLWHVWQTDMDYSAGQIVPLAALYMAWTGREWIRNWAPQCWLPGLLLSIVGVGLHLVGDWYLYASLRYFGMILCATGVLAGLLGGGRAMRFAYPLAALFLMMPLPTRMHESVMLPLQTLSASVSGTILETIGIPAVRMGHVLEISGHKIAVAEACSGLRLALAFLIVTVVVAYVVRRPTWQRAMVLCSSIPIALACNVVRIVIAACLHNAGYSELAEGIFHDAAGFLMIPLALLLLALELRILADLSLPAADWGSLHRRVGAAPLPAGR